MAGVTRVPGGGQCRAVTQLGLRGVHDGHHPVPGGDELVLHVVLDEDTRNENMRTVLLKLIHTSMTLKLGKTVLMFFTYLLGVGTFLLNSL